MQNTFLVAVTALACALPIPAQEPAQRDARHGGGWLTDYDDALAAAKKLDRPILANFTGSDWCHWCKRLSQEVFATDAFRDWAREHVVLLELDFPRETEQAAALKKQNRELAKKHRVSGFPTVLFLDAGGNEIGRTGYVKGGAKRWLAKATAELAKAEAAPVWTEDYAEALERARKENKLVLADFTGSDWCGWCIKLDKEVFSTAEFAAWARKNVVLLKLDFPRKKRQSKQQKRQNAKLRDRYGIRGYPTVLFLNRKGEKVGQSGYVRGGPRAWIAAAEKAMRGKR
ncbi:MAG TPA: DUF255 domain-containing protein [bacterium]|nr:DUF255 domain-containing protein [bacterium]